MYIEVRACTSELECCHHCPRERFRLTVGQSLSAARLVTLTGPGGIGKTRLALRAAAAARRAFRDGVWLTALSDYLAARQALLILDGCERLTDGCAVLADALLRACPELRIMATSRHVLRVAGEVTVAVPPMTVPDEAGPGGPGDLSRYEAVRLFAERATTVLPEFVIDDGNGPVLEWVCPGP
jgi:non-specific serine/threonine protein kinase